jgi:DUF2905 family protein
VDLYGIGKLLLIAGVVLAMFGGVFLLFGKGVLPRLPGDFSFGKGSVRVFIPLGTSIVLSIVLTVLLNLFLKK